jgi:hypothetical protein
VFPQLSSNKNATLPTLVRGIMLYLKHTARGRYRSAGKEWLRRVPLKTAGKPLLAERK